ncbi:MAG: hypothetical protein LQ346_008715, partial [Caloplaca aetnensis]
SMVMALRDLTLENSATTHQKDILTWLDAPNPTPKYTNALQGRHPGTGSWYILSEAFDRWIKEPNSISWLWGIPGCGKTVLSATIIDRLTDLCSHHKDYALAYFYFAFDNVALQTVDGMIRSLAAQLCSQCISIPHWVESLYSRCSEAKSQPTHDSLRNMLCQLFGCFKQVFIVLDALDECTERHNLILALENIAGWQKSELHLLTTSRKELEIEECMNALTKEADRVGIQGIPIAGDISSFVLGMLRTDRRLKRWHKPELEKEIALTLTSKAHGMYVCRDLLSSYSPVLTLCLPHNRFQWVVCQLNTIASCRSMSELRRALLSLPKDLDDTYARILKAVDNDENHVQVFKILQLLVCSNEPITVAEAAETITIELDSTPQVDLERRLVEPDDVMTMCSALVVLETQEDSAYGRGPVLRLAHFSIREFLLSTRIQGGIVSHWHMDDISSHLFIARLFIAYLFFLEIDVDVNEYGFGCYAGPNRQFYLDYPLAAAAATRWPRHLSIAENSGIDLACEETGSQLFMSHSAATIQWPKFQTQHCMYCWGDLTYKGSWDDVGIRHGSLVFAAHHNLLQTARVLLACGANPNALFNTGNRRRGPVTPLAEASYMGHIDIVKELLICQADVELEPQECPNALEQACRGGSIEAIRLLLDHGADPNARLPGLPSPLSSALVGRDLADTSCIIVKMLLDAGANINDPVEVWWASLSDLSVIVFAVLCRCDTSTIKALLDHGADGVDCLVASCDQESTEEQIHFLLDYGIDVNARASVPKWTRSYRASVSKYTRSYRLSVPKWGRIGHRPPFWPGRTALESACTKNDPAIVRILLDHGADPNIRSELAASALEAYLNRSMGNLECEAAPIFALLLRGGADLKLVREDKLNGDGKTKYPAVLDRWKAWK